MFGPCASEAPSPDVAACTAHEQGAPNDAKFGSRVIVDQVTPHQASMTYYYMIAKHIASTDHTCNGQVRLLQKST